MKYILRITKSDPRITIENAEYRIVDAGTVAEAIKKIPLGTWVSCVGSDERKKRPEGCYKI